MQKQLMGVAALSAALAVADASQAQAVQWRVEDGGNGHWYEVLVVPSGIVWNSAASAAYERGGHLATLTSQAESDHAFQVAHAIPTAWVSLGNSTLTGPWLGGFQNRDAPDYSEPAGGWGWVTHEPWDFTRWSSGDPSETGSQDVIAMSGSCCMTDGPDWNDLNERIQLRSALIEWSADCNNDGIVDYGQCRDGTLPDYNGNNIPDCCENQAPCVVGHFPVQWRVEAGGNGHWYQRVPRIAEAWDDLVNTARQIGGDLTSIASGHENAFVQSVAFTQGGPSGHAALGAESPGGTCSVPWRWTDGTSLSYSNWDAFQPDCLPAVPEEIALMYASGRWHDYPRTGWVGEWTGAVLEWSADCNNDGVVDYGQILQGQLPDTNQNGVPDSCETPDCTTADLFRDFNVNGADLGILLAQWGPVNSLTVSDLNNDGAVDGIDLGLLLSFWGPCPG